MDPQSVESWFAEYVAAFTVCARGEAPVDGLFDYYGVPLLLTSDAGASHLLEREQGVAVLQSMVDGLQAAGCDHTETLASRTTVLNASSALHEGTFARATAGGTEIERLAVTYVVTDGAAGRRISAVLMHDAVPQAATS